MNNFPGFQPLFGMSIFANPNIVEEYKQPLFRGLLERFNWRCLIPKISISWSFVRPEIKYEHKSKPSAIIFGDRLFIHPIIKNEIEHWL